MKKICLIFLALISIGAQVFFIKEKYLYPSFLNCIFTQSIMSYLAFCLITKREELKKLARLASEEEIKKEESFFEKIGIFFLLLIFSFMISIIPFLLTHTTYYYFNCPNEIKLIHELKNPFHFNINFPFVKFETVKDAAYAGMTIGMISLLLGIIFNSFKRLFKFL